MENIPHFIIVGTMKSGTSSLMLHLRNHKDIHLPKYELHFFNRDKNFLKGKEWYENQLIAHKNEDVKIIGEKTPTYSYQKNVAQRIYNCYPNVKLIWIFRNPVARCYSNYLHAVRLGADDLSFKQAIEYEEKRKQKNIFLAYKDRSIYYTQVEHFLKFFPKDQMHFILFEELINPSLRRKIFRDLFAFLGVDFENFEYKDEIKNKTLKPRFPKTYNLARKLNIYQFGAVQQILKQLNFGARKKTFAAIPNDVSKELYQFFKLHNEKLSKIIEKDLSIWDYK